MKISLIECISSQDQSKHQCSIKGSCSILLNVLIVIKIDIEKIERFKVHYSRINYLSSFIDYGNNPIENQRL